MAKKPVGTTQSGCWESSQDRSGDIRKIVEASFARFNDNTPHNIQIVVDGIIDYMDRARESLRRDLDERIRYERLLSAITKEALKQRPITAFIQDVVSRLGKELDVSRVYLFEYDRIRNTVSNREEWIADGIFSSKEMEQDMPADDYPYWKQQLLSGQPVQIESPDKAPDDVTAKMMEVQGTHSILTLPFFVFGRPYGFLGFDECRFPRGWKQEDVELLRAVCHVMAQAIERERWSDEMVRVERMAAMGRIAGVVAHEINNPLQGMMLHLDLLATSLKGNKDAKKKIGYIEDGIRRITDIVWRIINLHREGMEEERVDINDIVKGVVMLLERQIEKKGCAVEMILDTSLPQVRGVKPMFHQAVLNVVLNAMESVHAGGHMNIATSDDGESVVVEVRDDGAGIEAEDLPHIFEPFFTSKEEARPGLGLYIAHAVVTAQQGQIAVESTREQGTTVTIRFPEITEDDQ